jgi:hypothetical protein
MLPRLLRRSLPQLPLVALACWLALAVCGPARADVTVTSPRADSVAVTIYRDDLALVTETRTVDLPAEPVTLVLAGVVETLLPPSAVIADTGRALAESNFDFDRLTPASLLARSVGKTVTLTRTHRATGRVTRTAAIIEAAGDGVVLRTADGLEALHCSGLPERLELDEVPGALAAEPRLSVKLAAGAAAKRTVKVSYLAHGFGWSSDYVARLNERADAASLNGWITLTNGTSASFEQAQVQVVAGALNLLDVAEGGSRGSDGGAAASVDERSAAIRAAAEQDVALLSKCFAAPVLARPAAELGIAARAFKSDALEEVVVTGARVAAREQLGDYQLYRLPWLTDLGARQTKQVAFLSKPRVKVERLYTFRLPAFDAQPPERPFAPSLQLRFDNSAKAGLGEPLPAGSVRVLEPHAGAEVFAGEDEIADKPVGLPVELTIARALDIELESTTALRERGERAGMTRAAVDATHRVVNGKRAPIELEIRHAVGAGWQSARVRKSTAPMRKHDGDFAWRLKVRAGSELTLQYELEALELR